MEIIRPEDKFDPMEPTEREEASGVCCVASDNSSEEASSLMLLEPQRIAVQETTPSRRATVRKRCLVEVFAVLCLENEETVGINKILEENLVLRSKISHKLLPDYVLYKFPPDNCLEINSQGYLILTGPECGMEVEKYFSVGPSYDVNKGGTFSNIVWNAINDNPFENFMCDWLESKNCFMVVKFSVYRDGLEAWIELTISDLELHGMPGLKIPLEIYGTVQTSNSAVPHSQAKSYLFDHSSSDNCAILELDPSCKAEVPLPLSRRVTVIPRESTLIVDVSLFLQRSSGDISIANESVSFHPSTRSNCTVEEHIIKGQHAKVKVKVTWVEAFEDNKNAEEEKGEVIEDEEAVDEECNREDGKGAVLEISDDDRSLESEYVSDDNSSFGSHKLRRLSSSQDISTRVDDRHTTGTMETMDQGQGAGLHLESPERFKLHYLEVFSVKLLDIENLKMDEVYGLIMIHTGMPTHLLFRRVRGYPSKISSEGFAILEGPRRCGWSVCDNVSIVPFLFKYQELHFTDDKLCYDLWHDLYYDKSHYDKLLSKTLNTDVGRIEVNFAVYDDGVEAHLSVMLTDCCFSWARVHGTIIASNSMLQNPVAKSYVLKKDKTESDRVIVGHGKVISLPLSRPIVTLPFDSTLALKFDLLSDDEVIFHGKPNFSVELGSEDEQTFPGNGCCVKVNVRFSYQDYSNVDDKSFFF